MVPRTASLQRRKICGGTMTTTTTERQRDQGKTSAAPSPPEKRRLTKLLVKVTMERSLGAVQVVMSSEDRVADLVRAALEIYVAEKRRPLLPETDPHHFELHYSRFSFESLEPEEKLISLGSRNFFLCLKPVTNASSSKSSCSAEAKKEATNSSFPWTKLMDFLL